MTVIVRIIKVCISGKIVLIAVLKYIYKNNPAAITDAGKQMARCLTPCHRAIGLSQQQVN